MKYASDHFLCPTLHENALNETFVSTDANPNWEPDDRRRISATFWRQFSQKLTDINPYKSWGLKGTLYFILKRYPRSTIRLNYMLMYPRLNTKRAKIRQEVKLNE